MTTRTWAAPVGADGCLGLGATARLAAVFRWRIAAAAFSGFDPRAAGGGTGAKHRPIAPPPVHCENEGNEPELQSAAGRTCL